jgi:hypothetical protein
MIPYDTEVTTIDCEGIGTAQLFESSPSSDELCERTTTVYVPAATTCELYFADGSTEPVGSLDMRATEFTVGSTGPEAMPGGRSLTGSDQSKVLKTQAAMHESMPVFDLRAAFSLSTWCL